MRFYSYLPTENWNDVFGFLPRCQLGELVPQIGDWYFASKAQFYLHECGQITLGWLNIGPSSINENANPIVEVVVGPEEEQLFWGLPLADVPMPTNVKNFKGIRLRLVCVFIVKFV
jgi:hypothetical protein